MCKEKSKGESQKKLEVGISHVIPEAAEEIQPRAHDGSSKLTVLGMSRNEPILPAARGGKCTKTTLPSALHRIRNCATHNSSHPHGFFLRLQSANSRGYKRDLWFSVQAVQLHRVPSMEDQEAISVRTW